MHPGTSRYQLKPFMMKVLLVGAEQVLFVLFEGDWGFGDCLTRLKPDEPDLHVL